MKFDFDWPKQFLRCLKGVDNGRTDRRQMTDDGGLPIYKLTSEPSAQVS